MRSPYITNSNDAFLFSIKVLKPNGGDRVVCQKVAVGDYETASEVVREGLRLLKQRDDLWKAEVRSRIKQGMDLIRAGGSIPAQQVKAQMAAFKKNPCNRYHEFSGK